MNKKAKIYQMNECDSVIAYSKKEAVDWYWEEFFGSNGREEIRAECERVKDLAGNGLWYNQSPDKFMETVMNLKAGEELRICNWSGDPAYWITFEEFLENLIDKVDIPGIICSTEY